jgi:hypothetical protein
MEHITIEAALDFRNREELIDYVVERKVNELTYGGLDGIVGYIDKTLGLKLFGKRQGNPVG